MSVDTHIYLSHDVHVSDVADVMGILAGLPKGEDNFLGFWTCVVKGATVKNNSEPACCTIYLEGDMVDGELNHHAFYSFETSNYKKPGEAVRMISVRATPFWIAMGIGLVKFFGGYVDFYDTDAKGKDFEAPYPKDIYNCPEDCKDFDDFQSKKLNLKALTKKDIQNAKKLSGCLE